MPFINELLADNQQQNLRETPRTRTSRFDFEPDAIAQRLQHPLPQKVVPQKSRGRNGNFPGGWHTNTTCNT